MLHMQVMSNLTNKHVIPFDFRSLIFSWEEMNIFRIYASREVLPALTTVDVHLGK